MGLLEAFAPVIADQKAEVMAMTWGHLAPKVGTHKGSVWVALSERESNEAQILKTEFPTMEASPWEYEVLSQIVFELSSNDTKVLDEYNLYKLTGSIIWGEIIPEDFNLEEWKEDWAKDDKDSPDFPQGLIDWDFEIETILQF